MADSYSPGPPSVTVDESVFDVKIISRFALELLQKNTLEDLLWGLAESVGKLLGFDDCVIYLREDEVLVQSAAYGVKNPYGREIQNPLVIPIGRGIVGAVFESGRSELVGDTVMDPRYIFDEYSGRSELTVPIIFEGKILGVLDSETDTKDGYSDTDLQRFEALANICAPRIAQCLTQRNLDRALAELLAAADKSMEANRQLQHEIEIRKQAELELQEHQENLQGLVEQRTQALREREEQLHQSQKMEAIGTLAGGIAHDFNNVLASISGYTELALESEDIGAGAAANLQEVRNATHRAIDLVKQILTFSRSKAMDKAVIDLVEVIGEFLKLMRPTLPSSIELSAHCDVDEARVFADQTQMHQVLLNLCTNAAAAIGHQAGTIRLHLRPADEGEAFDLLVHDSGCGISQSDMGRIFDPFFTTKQVGEGTGLGLSVVSSIIEDHEGAITVHSSPGAGTTFRIRLPLTTAEKPPPQAEHAENRRGSGHVLVVDDEEMLLRLYQTTLEQSGYRVTTAHNGATALDLYRANPDEYDLIVSDETMPRLTGRELAQEVQALRSGQPFILCSGFNQAQEEDSEPAGISGFLTKPVRLDDLTKAVGIALENTG